MKVYIAKIVFYFIVCPMAWFYISSCNESNSNQNESAKKNAHSKNSIIKKPGSSFNDTIVIQTKAAVFYSPDSQQMQKIKAVNEKNVFDMLVHDCHYQMQNALNSLKQDWPKIKIINASKARYLLFVKENKSTVCIDLDTKNDICGLFLFDTKKDPILADMPNINTVLQYYFSQ
jgi:hypothetical protein